MKITGATWSPEKNILFIKCNCGNTINHVADKWIVKCPKCGRIENLQDIREDYTNESDKV